MTYFWFLPQQFRRCVWSDDLLTGGSASPPRCVKHAVVENLAREVHRKLYHHVPTMALPIHFPVHFFRHFCCRMYRLRRSAASHNEKPNRRNFPVWNSHGQRSHVTMAIPDAAFSAVRLCSYTVRQLYASSGTALCVYLCTNDCVKRSIRITATAELFITI